MQYIGIIGLLALAAGWIPQTVETIKQKKCGVNFSFLILNLIGSISLTIYAILLNDPVFTILNSMTTLGAVINLFYKIRSINGVNA
jgi:MtN3 and saliva related transmembrane protein